MQAALIIKEKKKKKLFQIIHIKKRLKNLSYFKMIN